jgi:hypothetical protein
VAGRCGHPLNQFAAYACFGLFCVQPWTANEWMWALATQRGGRTSFTPEHKRLVRWLALLFALSLGSRALPCLAPLCHGCDPAEPLCSGSGPACALEGHWHAYWRVPLRPAGPLAPGLWAHVALTFLPTLANGGPYFTFERGLVLALFFTGAGLALLLCAGGNAHEAPALWTLTVLPQRVLSAALAYASKDDAVVARRVPPTQPPGGGGLLPAALVGRQNGGKNGRGGGEDEDDSDLGGGELDDDEDGGDRGGVDGGDDEELSDESSDEDEAESLIRYGLNGQLRRRKKL